MFSDKSRQTPCVRSAYLSGHICVYYSSSSNSCDISGAQRQGDQEKEFQTRNSGLVRSLIKITQPQAAAFCACSCVKPGAPDFYHTRGPQRAAATSSSCISITWKLFKVNVSAPSPLNLQNQNLSGGSPAVCILINPPVSPHVCQRLRTIALIMMAPKIEL